MTLKEQMTINQFGQSLRPIEDLLNQFSSLSIDEKRIYLRQLSGLIWQSKPIDSDIEQVVGGNFLKSTFTPCVILRTHRLVVGLPKIINLPEEELEKAYVLLLQLFKIAYLRRFEVEKGHPDKWWYADLSDQKFVRLLLSR